MQKKMDKKNKYIWAASFFIFCVGWLLFHDQIAVYAQRGTNVAVEPGGLGFKVPDFIDIITFAIRLFFVLAGIAALFYGLWGAFTWVTSGGEQENLDKARQKIVAALVGVILIVVILAIIVTLEQFVFQERVCLGLSCPVTIPGILERCLPNPQYGKTEKEIAKIRAEDPNWGYDLAGPGGTVNIGPDVECCPHGLPVDSPYRSRIRLTTGWGAGTKYFGNNDHKICCLYGDFDGNQICDGWDQGIGVFPL
jgi:hypothetical protein